MITWYEFYEKNKDNIYENHQSLWMKYNNMVYVHSLYSGNSGGRKSVPSSTDDTTNNYVVDEYVIDYLE